MALSASLYLIENWNIKARDARRIRAAQMKHMRKQQDILRQNIKQTQRLQRNKYHSIFGQNTGIHKKLVATYKQKPHNRIPRIL
jgi:anthranilate/para-aminobenzoate synthase component II